MLNLTSLQYCERVRRNFEGVMILLLVNTRGYAAKPIWCVFWHTKCFRGVVKKLQHINFIKTSGGNNDTPGSN